MIHCILAIIFGVFALAADQYTKYYIETNFEIGQAKEFINGFINLIYYRNNGAAWGIFSGRTWLLILLTLFLMAISIFVFIKYSKNSKLIIWSLPFIFFGGIGNLIDRIFRNGEVIDFLHFEFYPEFPIFNVADCTIVLGAGLLILYVILDTINGSNKKQLDTSKTESEVNAKN